MGDGVVGRRTEVEEESAARDRTPCLVDGHRPRRGDASAEEGRTCLVRRPHPGEVARNRGLAMEQPTREVLDVLDPEQRVVSPLVADRRRRRRGDARGAQRARAVGRLDDHVVVVREDHLVERPVHIVGVGHRVLLAEQVRPPHGADEQRAAGEQERRVLAPRGVGDRVDDVLRRVAGRVAGHEPQGADVERGAVSQRPMLVGEGGPGPDQVGRAGQRGKLAAARDVVVVEMRLDDVADADVDLTRGVEIRINVPPGVHHRGDAGGVVGDQRREVAEPLDPEQPREHRIEGSTRRSPDNRC